ncbi:MAG: hypothetical protein JW944_13275, partial [Deltaproteobacteria bacterium]|nr:hypothetical protein [Deltaproteobacteria bacterium]
PFVARLPGQIPAGQVCSGIAATIDMLPTLANLAGAKLSSKPLDGVDIWPLFTGKQKEIEREALLYWQGWNLTAARLGKWKVRFMQSSLGMGGMGGGMPPGGQQSGGQGQGQQGAGAQAGGQPGDGSGRGQQGAGTPAGGQPGAGLGQGQQANPPGGGQAMGGSVDETEVIPSLYNLEDDPDESENVAKAHPEIVAQITARVEKLVPGFPENVQTAWASIKSKWSESGSAQAK